MNFKKTALALAVAGVIAAPMAAQAESGFYGSARIGLENVDMDVTNDDDSMTIKSHASRFGFRGSNDLGNGMTGFGRYEFGVGNSGLSTRHAYVGLKGGFGEVRVIEQGYTAFYNHVTGPVDQPFWNSGYGFLRTGRNKNAINYEGGSGAFSFGVTVEANGSEDGPSGTAFAGSFDLGAVKIGLGVHTDDEDAAAINSATATADDFVTLNEGEGVTGLTVSGSGGFGSYAVTFQTAETVVDENGDNSDVTGVEANLWLANNIYFQYGQKDYDDFDTTTSGMTVGYLQSIGNGVSAWYEYTSFDGDDAFEDYTALHAVLKIDWK